MILTSVFILLSETFCFFICPHIFEQVRHIVPKVPEEDPKLSLCDPKLPELPQDQELSTAEDDEDDLDDDDDPSLHHEHHVELPIPRVPNSFPPNSISDPKSYLVDILLVLIFSKPPKSKEPRLTTCAFLPPEEKNEELELDEEADPLLRY